MAVVGGPLWPRWDDASVELRSARRQRCDSDRPNLNTRRLITDAASAELMRTVLAVACKRVARRQGQGDRRV